MKELRIIAVKDIAPSGTNPRTCFDESKLNELARSIKRSGLAQPLLVRRLSRTTFELIAGERRWRASQRAGLREVPCVVTEVSPAQLLELQIVENSQREDVNPMDEARALNRLRVELGYDVADIAERIGKSEPYVYNMLQMCGLPQPAQELIYTGRISKAVAWQIIRIKDPKHQAKAARDLARGEHAEKMTTEAGAKYYIVRAFGEDSQARARKPSDAKDVRYGKQPTNFYSHWKWFLVRFSAAEFEQWKAIVRNRTDDVILREAVEAVMIESNSTVRPLSYKDPNYQTAAKAQRVG